MDLNPRLSVERPASSANLFRPRVAARDGAVEERFDDGLGIQAVGHEA
jgi:hypothetical protein